MQQGPVKLALKNKRYVTALRAYCFLGRELSKGTQELSKLFGESVDKTIKKLSRAGYYIPRDVIVLRSQYDALEPDDYGPLSQISRDAIPKLDVPEWF